MKASIFQRRPLRAAPHSVLRQPRAFLAPDARASAAPGARGHDFSRVAIRAPEPASGGAPPAQAGAPIQRVLNVTSSNVPEDIRKALRKSVKKFNNYGQANQNTQHALHQQFAMLDAIERRVNQHLRDNSATVTDTQRQELFGLLNQTQQHHEDLTRRNVAGGHRLWLRDASQLSRQEQNRRQALWTSLTTGTGAGNLKVVTPSDAFRSQVHSGFAQLLQGQHGTGMLADLNRSGLPNDALTGPARHVVISDDHSRDLTNLYAPHRRNNSPGSWAERHTGGVGPRGSQVQIQEGGPPASLGEYESDPTDKAIFAPRYITLGHELGHARHILAGTDRANQWHGDEAELTGQELERTLWTNPEEHFNITTEENPLRAEHDLPQRKYHGTINATNARIAEHGLRSRFERLVSSVPDAHRRAVNPHLGRVNGVLNGTDYGNNGQIATATGHVDQLERDLPGLVRAEQWKALKASVSSAPAALASGALNLAGRGLAWWRGENG